jgi:hypothetical protein
MKRALVATVFAGTTLLSGGTAVAQPPPDVVQDGLVNVNVGDVTILEDVRVAVAAQVTALICGVQVGPVVILGRAVDRGDEPLVEVCEVDQAPITITQNT